MYRALAEQIAALNPWDLGVWRVENTLVRPWVDGYKKHVYREHAWLYLDVDPAARKRRPLDSVRVGARLGARSTSFSRRRAAARCR